MRKTIMSALIAGGLLVAGAQSAVAAPLSGLMTKPAAEAGVTIDKVGYGHRRGRHFGGIYLGFPGFYGGYGRGYGRGYGYDDGYYGRSYYGRRHYGGYRNRGWRRGYGGGHGRGYGGW